MGTLFRALIVLVIVVGLVAAGGLAIMAMVAGTHDVKRVDVPKESSLFTMSTESSYADAYRRPMEFNSYRNIKQMVDNISVKGDGEVNRTDKEVVYHGHLPGIDYHVAYALDRSGFPPAIEMVTCYRIKDSKGKCLWQAFRPTHRCTAP